MAVGVFFYLVPILTNFRATKRWNTNGREELREVTYVPLVHWSAGWSWNSRATRGGHFQLFFIHNIERWRCEDWLWMGKIVTGLCNSNSVIEQLFVYTLLANDFMACEIVCRQVKWAQRARNALVSHLTKLFTTVVSECTFNRKQKMWNKDRCMRLVVRAHKRILKHLKVHRLDIYLSRCILGSLFDGCFHRGSGNS